MTIKIAKPDKPLTLQEGIDTPNSVCPHCGYKMDRAAAVTDSDCPEIIPKEGDVSLCMRCTALLVFNADLTVRDITAEEIASLDAETRSILSAAKWAIEKAWERKNRGRK